MSLALIAGRGGLPARVAAAQAEPPLVCAYEGCAPDGLKPDLTFRLETLGSLLAHLLGVGIRDVCLCGAIDRPTLDPAKLDIRTAPLVPQFKQALAAGDNGALEVIKTIFEDHGLRVVGADELVPDLIADSGVFSDGLRMIGVPQAIAGASLCATWLRGWLNGVIAAADRSGSRVVKILRALPCGVMSQEKICPSSFSASMAANWSTSWERPTSYRVSRMQSPVSLRIRSANSSARASKSCRAVSSTCDRS